jgi:hypothetical protein
MQLNAEIDVKPSRTEAAVSPRKHKSRAVRKVTVRLTEEVCERLQVAAERPGVGKSMIVDAALDRARSLAGERRRFADRLVVPSTGKYDVLAA